jgi:hypothetical protein
LKLEESPICRRADPDHVDVELVSNTVVWQVIADYAESEDLDDYLDG